MKPSFYIETSVRSNDDMSYKLGVDVGGTFTDIVLLNEDNGNVDYTKTLSSKEDPSTGILEGINKILNIAKVNPHEVEYFIHGTTFATNAFLEKSGSEVALFTTEGFRDVIEIGRQKRPELYDLFQDKPSTLVERQFRYGIQERINAKGEIIKEIDENNVIQAIEEMKRAGIKSVAIVYLHSYVNSINEQKTKEIINRYYPECEVSLSSNISPEFREYERTVTTIINAYLKPKTKIYFQNLSDIIQKENIEKPYIMKSSGGAMTLDTASNRVVETLLSGPAAGVAGSAFLAKQKNVKNIITLDMGGTSADVAMILNQTPKTTTESNFSGYPIKTAMVDMETIGAGGGSIASVSKEGLLTVGPRSAGAYPGPVCYGNGGTEPTITDANVILGRINPNTFHEGEIQLDIEAAKRSLEPLMKKTNKSLEEVALGIIEIANHRMAETIRLVTVKKGYDPKDFYLFAFGGASPLHVSDIADSLNISKVIIPKISSEMSAFGLLTADIRHDFAITQLTNLQSEELPMIKEMLQTLREKGEEILNKEGVTVSKRLYVHTLDLRYKGQAFEIPIEVNTESESALRIENIRSQFKDEYKRQYGHSDDNDQIEIVNYRMAAFGITPELKLKEYKPGKEESLQSARKKGRKVYLKSTGKYEDIPIYDRGELVANNKIIGPAIIDDVDTTIMLETHDSARFDEIGNIIIKVGDVSYG